MISIANCLLKAIAWLGFSMFLIIVLIQTIVYINEVMIPSWQLTLFAVIMMIGVIYFMLWLLFKGFFARD